MNGVLGTGQLLLFLIYFRIIHRGQPPLCPFTTLSFAPCRWSCAPPERVPSPRPSTTQRPTSAGRRFAWRRSRSLTSSRPPRYGGRRFAVSEPSGARRPAGKGAASRRACWPSRLPHEKGPSRALGFVFQNSTLTASSTLRAFLSRACALSEIPGCSRRQLRHVLREKGSCFNQNLLTKSENF